MSGCQLADWLVTFRSDCEWVNNICAKAYTDQICIDPSTKRLMFSEKFKICCGKNGTVRVIVIHDPNHEAKDMAVESEASSANAPKPGR